MRVYTAEDIGKKLIPILVKTEVLQLHVSSLNEHAESLII